MKKNNKILFDWGGTIIRDDLLFKDIAENSGNENATFDGPDCWDNIRVIGNENYFDNIQDKFLLCGVTYDKAIDVVSKYTSNEKLNSFSYVVFDNKPFLDKIKSLDYSISQAVRLNNGVVNGIYAEGDKVRLCKEVGINIAVDDDPRIALSLASAGIKTILVSRIWNRRFDLDNINLYIPYRKKAAIKDNLQIAEDWHDVDIRVNNIIRSI